ncbi:phage tail protein [Novosphingobium pituita]|uniref:Phage tail protein n=1 Tax=Novosphingobium pituita TaxID=3056842 RepID=A0ABQ6P3M6_9SPHN|nr:phage tail protein [Novosphingobium sp. IK01]GMM59868.1 phage tail protein [Novosphingobium sp. IK01]
MKAQSLRDGISAVFPDLAKVPDRFNMWIDKGVIHATNAGGHGFEWQYTLNIVVEDFTAHPSMMFLVICEWARHNQPDLLQPGKEAFRFEADIIDAKTVDLHVEIPLTERVQVITDASGAAHIEHLEEPASYLPDDDELAPGAVLKRLMMDSMQVLPATQG